jgi:Protein of unknown function (DUF1282).
MYKKLFNIAISLIFKPSEAWVKLKDRRKDDDESFLSDYIYPFIGFITIAAFLGILFTRKEFDVQIALKASILSLMSVMGGFFLASYIVNEMWYKLFHRENDFKLCMYFVGYSSSLMFLLNILLSLLPEFFFLRIFVLYTIYIMWEGVIPYMGVNESEQLKFVSLSTIIVIATPLAIEFILGLWMPGLKF